MPRNASTSIENNFIGGFVTQATGLNFPDNAAFEQDNVVFSERGIASRRPGMDFENNFLVKQLDRSDRAQTTYHWKNVASDGSFNIVVQQNGSDLYFYDTSNDLSLSAGILPTIISLTSFQAISSHIENLRENECQFSTGQGFLFVVHPYCDPFYVQYNPDTSSFTSRLIIVEIRDTNGLIETGNIDDRPTSLSDNHKYNLLNQGWTTTKITDFHTAASAYPSNADVWQIFKNATDIYDPATTLASNSRGSTPAPRGFFRLSAWSTSRESTALIQSGVTLVLSGGVSADESSGTTRPSVTEFHAGRIFYTGVAAPKYNNRIYFSKIIEGTDDFGKCYSVNDPTSENLFDFLPSDGGIISIPQAGTIYRLVSLGPTLLVFGANGVYAISGSIGIGFSATDFTVAPVKNVRSISGSSFISFEGSVAWWNGTGINIVQQTKDGLDVQSMTDKTIKDYYLDINPDSKKYARGVYNPRTHLLQWIFRSQPFSNFTDTYSFDTVISFNTLIGAFYTWLIPNTSVTLNSLVTIEGAGSLTSSDDIIDNLGGPVVDNNGDPLVTFGFSQTSVSTTTKFLVSYVDSDYFFTFAECFNVVYKDWTQLNDGEDYVSYFITGYRLKTQGERAAQVPYIFLFSDLEDGENSYKFQSLWDYANNPDSGRWSQKQTILHTEFDRYDVGRRKLKIRGAGAAVQFKFISVSGKPFNIIGWSTYDTANAAP